MTIETPTGTVPLGYAALIAAYGLDPIVNRPLRCASLGDSWKKAELEDPVSGRTWVRHRPHQAPKPGLAGDGLLNGEDPRFLAWHLDFALRNEGVNLAVLGELFQASGAAGLAGQHVADWVRSEPTGRHARRAWFIAEWLTGNQLDLPDSTIEGFYVPAVDPKLQVAPAIGARSRRHHVVDNMPGTPEWCPMVWITPGIEAMRALDLSGRARKIVAEADPETSRRAAGWLFAKETRDSFAIEQERPSPEKERRFVQMLARAAGINGRYSGAGPLLAEQDIHAVVAEVLDGTGRNAGYRATPNYVFKKSGGWNRGVVDYISPDPNQVPAMMRGLVAQANRLAGSGIDPVVVASMLKFGLVYIHPFDDGNGRTSRFLVHSTLASTGYAPQGGILPVSAAMLRDMDGYDQALEGFSRPLLDRLSWSLDDDGSLKVKGNGAGSGRARHYRYMDLTRQTEFLYRCVERTVDHDLPQEIAFIEGFDDAVAGIRGATLVQQDTAELMAKLIHENGGTLSRKKRKSFFSDLGDAQVAAAEKAVVDAMGAHGAEMPARPGAPQVAKAGNAKPGGGGPSL